MNRRSLLTGALLFTSTAVTAMAAEKPIMRDFIGINGHTILFRPDLYSPIGTLVRDYHPMDWDLSHDPSKLPEWPVAQNGTNWDSVWGAWMPKGWRIDACLMFEQIPQDKWNDFEKEGRAYGESFAKYFGPSSEKKLVSSVEIGNEPGKWSDKDYSKMLKAMAEGVRKGDPKMQIATCNVAAQESGEYHKSVSCLKGLNDYYDIINTHVYAQLEMWPRFKRSYPEDPKLLDYLTNLEKLIKWRDANAKGKPIWITEFGYDSSTKKAGPGDPFPEWVGVTDTQQAQWIVRSLLIFASMDIERAYIYFFNDDDQPSFHACAGLTRGYVPKPSFWSVAHLQKTLGDFRFSKTLSGKSEKVTVQEYVTPDAKKVVWVAWSPTGDEKTVKHVFRNAPGRLVSIEKMPLSENEDVTVKPEPKGNTLELEITESPTYLVFEK